MQNSAADSSKTKSLVLVTGGNGYIGSFLVKLLLENNFKVRVSVRDLSNKSNYEYLYSVVPEKKGNLEIVQAVLTNKDQLIAAVQGCKYVFHVASPTFDDPGSDGMKVIEPAVSGTLNVLEAALENGVKRIVTTSSAITTMLGHKTHEITEEDWSEESSDDIPYAKSKIRAEKVTWEFYEKNKDKIEVVTIIPTFVIGPVLCNRANTSTLNVTAFMDGSYLGSLDENLPIADVRDVAEAHYKAMFTDGANGKRYLCTAAPVKVTEIVSSLNEEFGKLGFHVPDKKVTPEEVLKDGRGFAKNVADLMIRGNTLISNERSVKDLGLKYRSYKETFSDAVHSLIEHGFLSKQSVKE